MDKLDLRKTSHSPGTASTEADHGLSRGDEPIGSSTRETWGMASDGVAGDAGIMRKSSKLKSNWRRTHPRVRKPIVLIAGSCVILLSGAIGWLPGPGGIPLFLLGIAILASEFAWADSIKRYILAIIYGCGTWYRSHKIIGALLLIVSLSLSLYMTLTFLHVI